MVLKSVPEQGQLVQIRSRPWVVSSVRANLTPPTGLPMPSANREHLVSLSSVEDDGLGEELQVIWEIEPGAKILERITLPTPLCFDSPTNSMPFWMLLGGVPPHLLTKKTSSPPSVAALKLRITSSIL